MMLLGCGFKIALRLDRAEKLSDIGYLCQDRHFRQRVQYILSVAASGAASLIQDGNHAGVRFRADGASEALLELDLQDSFSFHARGWRPGMQTAAGE